jgi:hypothetical protein
MDRADRIDHSRSVLAAVLLAMAAATLAACGAGIAATSGSGASPIATTPSSTPSTPAADVTDAEQAALQLFVADPSVAGHWNPCSNSDNWAACPLSGAVKARLADLTSQGYFGDMGGCAEEYISGTQNGLDSAPTVLSGVAGGDGSVTVVIRRGPAQPHLTAVMTKDTGTWLAAELASGSGPAASVFSTKPNC